MKTASSAGMRSRYLSDPNLNNSYPSIRNVTTDGHKNEMEYSLAEKLAKLGITVNGVVPDLPSERLRGGGHSIRRSSDQTDFIGRSGSDVTPSPLSENGRMPNSHSDLSHPPPPSAFSDERSNYPESGSASPRRGSFNHVIIDYNDMNRRCSDDSNELSFYSDSSYYKSSGLALRSGDGLSRAHTNRHSLISSASSGMSGNSINSFEVRTLLTQLSKAALTFETNVTLSNREFLDQIVIKNYLEKNYLEKKWLILCTAYT